MFKKNYVVSLISGTEIASEDKNGTIYLPNGTSYSLRIRNKNPWDTLAKLSIDGKFDSNIFIPASKTIIVEGFRDTLKKFEFKIPLANNPELEFAPNSDNGKIRVEFYKRKDYNNNDRSNPKSDKLLKEMIEKLNDNLKRGDWDKKPDWERYPTYPGIINVPNTAEPYPNQPYYITCNVESSNTQQLNNIPINEIGSKRFTPGSWTNVLGKTVQGDPIEDKDDNPFITLYHEDDIFERICDTYIELHLLLYTKAPTVNNITYANYIECSKCEILFKNKNFSYCPLCGSKLKPD